MVSLARCISGEWEAIVMGSRTTLRAPAAWAASMARFKGSTAPEMTFCPSQFSVATPT